MGLWTERDVIELHNTAAGKETINHGLLIVRKRTRVNDTLSN
jgi:hypothetical protein